MISVVDISISVFTSQNKSYLSPISPKYRWRKEGLSLGCTFFRISFWNSSLTMQDVLFYFTHVALCASLIFFISPGLRVAKLKLLSPKEIVIIWSVENRNYYLQLQSCVRPLAALYQQAGGSSFPWEQYWRLETVGIYQINQREYFPE